MAKAERRTRMELKARIRTKVHNIAVGATFSEELSETLDSGAIIIDNSPSFKLRPYDDVFVYDGVFNGVPLPRVQKALKIDLTSTKVNTWSDNIDYQSELTQINQPGLYWVNGIGKFKNWYTNFTPLTADNAPYRFPNNLIIRISVAYDSGSGVVITPYYQFTARETHSTTREIHFYNATLGGTVRGYFDSQFDEFYLDKNQSFVSGGNTYTVFECDIKQAGLNYYQNAVAKTNAYTLTVGKTFIDELTTGTRLNESVKFAFDGNIYLGEVKNIVPNTSFQIEVNSLTMTFNLVGTNYIATFNNSATIKFIEWTYTYKRGEWTPPTFYKHLLVDTFTKEKINLRDNLYKYKITLMSETKGLEKVQIPNRAFRQPFNVDKKQSVAQMAERLVEQYSPKVKVVFDATEKTYLQQQKYWLDDSVLEIYKDVYVEVALNNPTLRDLLNYLFSTKDRVAVVRDNIIYAVDQTERLGEFVVDNDINFISESMSSENYAGHLKRNYNQAVAQPQSGRMVEYLGFRDRKSGLLTLDNLKLETRFDIYNIDRVYLCYYKKVEVLYEVGDLPVDKMILVKQDITPLVVEETRRQLLSKDWADFNNTSPSSVEELAEYRLATVGYQRGSKEIIGWGEKYTYPQGWWDNTKTYIENIVQFMDSKYPFGINTYGYLKESLVESIQISAPDIFPNDFIHPFDNTSQGLKSFIFQVEYTPFYNGTIIHSKDFADNDIVANDNPSSSLTMLEADGLFEKEKINRLGNTLYQINAMHSGYSSLRELQTVYGNDVIIFKREYSIYNDFIIASYNGTEDYVLKNYYTSVFSKLRPFPLLSYDESVVRAENKKVFMLLSRDKLFNDTQLDINFSNFSTDEYYLLSGLYPSPILRSINHFDTSNKINAGYFVINGAKYLSDINVFVSGYSLCINLQMYDNISGGQYWSKLQAEGADNFVGTELKDYIAVDDYETGFIENMGVYVCHLNQENVFNDKVDDYSQSKVDDLYENILGKLPKMNVIGEETNIIGGEYKVNKDNQERLDFTFQVEPIADEHIIVTQWLMKLSDLLGIYNKVAETYEVIDTNGAGQGAWVFASNLMISPSPGVGIPGVQIDIPNSIWSSVTAGKPISMLPIKWNVYVPGNVGEYTLEFKYLRTKTEEYITIQAQEKFKLGTITRNKIKILTFYRMGYKPSGFNTSAAFDPNYPFGWNADTIDHRSFGWRKPYKSEIDDIENTATYEIGFERDMIPTTGGKEMVENFLGNSLTGYLIIDDATVSQDSTYTKNMYLLLSDEYMKKDLVYDEYKLSDLPTRYTIYPEDIGSGFEIRKDPDGMYIYADLTNPVFEGKKSMEYWFLDEQSGSLKLVMGADILPEDYTSGRIIINVSFIGTMDKFVYNSQSLLIGERANYFGRGLALDKNYYDDIIE